MKKLLLTLLLTSCLSAVGAEEDAKTEASSEDLNVRVAQFESKLSQNKPEDLSQVQYKTLEQERLRLSTKLVLASAPLHLHTKLNDTWISFADRRRDQQEAE